MVTGEKKSRIRATITRAATNASRRSLHGRQLRASRVALANARSQIRALNVADTFNAMIWNIALSLQARPSRVELGVKGWARSDQKVRKDYSGDVTRLMDAVRGTLAFYTLSELRTALDVLTHVDGVTIRKDRLAAPLANGYRDVMLDVVIAGVHCELQLHLDAVLVVKDQYHWVYECGRTHTPISNRRAVKRAEAEAYSSAWEASNV